MDQDGKQNDMVVGEQEGFSEGSSHHREACIEVFIIVMAVVRSRVLMGGRCKMVKWKGHVENDAFGRAMMINRSTIHTVS